MYKINVAVLFGGCSEEHTVSIKSAIELAANIDTGKYQPFYIGITKSGVWKLCESPAWIGNDMQNIRSSFRREEIRMVF